MILGAHISVAGGVDRAPERCHKFRISAMQIFTKNQNRWKGRKYKPDEIKRYFENLEKFKISHVVSHDSYLINLASADETKFQKSFDAFMDEMDRCQTLKIPFLVMHPGSHLGKGEDFAVKKIGQTLTEIFEKNSNTHTMVLLETTAGQGTNVGYKFEHLRDIMGYCKYPDRLGICVDTCHIFAAGYDFSSEEKYSDVKEKIRTILGIDKIKVFHFNDSKREAGSRIDRHEEIGEGKIGLMPFKFFLKDEEFAEIPAILETPGGEQTYDINLEKLRQLL